MESEQERWLKRQYSAVETETDEASQECKKVKYVDIHNRLCSEFTSVACSRQRTSDLIKKAFPSSITKRIGKARDTYVFGIERSDVVIQQEGSELEHLRVQVTQLQRRVAELEKPPSQTVSIQNLDDELISVMNPSNSIIHGPNTTGNFQSFSVDKIIHELKEHAPEVYDLFSKLALSQRHTVDDDDSPPRLAELNVVTSNCTLLKGRSIRVLGLQLLISFMLIARATNKQAIGVLNHMGVCVSYWGTWKYFRQLTHEAKYQEAVRSGKWLWVYDNLNIHKSIRHEREDCHSKMMNVTARLAVRIAHLPDFEYDWSNTEHQRSRDSLKTYDFLPSSEDSMVLKERAILYVMEFLASNFPSLKCLQKYVPTTTSIHPVSKSEVMPMSILFKDEKYKDETIGILSQLVKDANLSGDNEVLIGDQLTCKIIRGCKIWRQSEQERIDSLAWANEIPGDFHFLWECLKVAFQILWGSPALVGSLCNVREIISRTRVDKAVKVFNIYW